MSFQVLYRNLFLLVLNQLNTSTMQEYLNFFTVYQLFILFLHNVRNTVHFVLNLTETLIMTSKHATILLLFKTIHSVETDQSDGVSTLFATNQKDLQPGFLALKYMVNR